MFNTIIIGNAFGILSLMTAIAIIYPTLINIFNSDFKYQRSIIKISQLGILLTVCLGLIHGLLMTQKSDLDFYSLNTYWIYAEGLFLFNLVVFLAFAFPQIKSDSQKLNYFNGAVILLLACHIGQKIIF